MKIIDEEQADNMMSTCSCAGLLYSCAELLRVAPNPHKHPFMEILEVWIQLMWVCAVCAQYKSPVTPKSATAQMNS